MLMWQQVADRNTEKSFFNSNYTR